MQKATTLSTILFMAMLAIPFAWAGSSEDSDREAARLVTKQATAAYNLGHYDEAASLYEEAYKLVPDPIFLYDIGQSYRQADKLDKALTAYRSYLRTAPENAPNRARVEAWVRELEWTSDLQAKTAAQKAAQRNETPAPVAPAPVPAPVAPAPVVPKPAEPAPPAEPQISHEQVPLPSISARPDLVSQAPKGEEAHPPASLNVGFACSEATLRRKIVADVQKTLENMAWRGHLCSLQCKRINPRQAPRRCVEILLEASAEMGTNAVAASAVLTHGRFTSGGLTQV